MHLRKTVSIVLLLVAFGISSHAQDVILIDYFKALSLNSDELRLYMSKLGLSNYNQINDENGIDFSWTTDRRIADTGENKSSLHVYIQKDGSRLLTFQTDYREDYLKFKKNVEFNGLKLIRQKNYNDFLIEFFANSFFESTVYAKPENHIMHYDISLKRLK